MSGKVNSNCSFPLEVCCKVPEHFFINGNSGDWPSELTCQAAASVEDVLRLIKVLVEHQFEVPLVSRGHSLMD